jgi:hypothetical protein
MKKNDILLILIPSFIFALAWIGFSIYHSVVTSTISSSLDEQITPINPTFDTNTINALKNREISSPLYSLGAISQTPVQATPTASPIVITVPISTSSGSQTPIATSGGGLTQ